MNRNLCTAAAAGVLGIVAADIARKAQRSAVRKERIAVFAKKQLREARVTEAKAVAAARRLLAEQVRNNKPLEHGPRIFIAEFLGFDPWNS